MKTRYRKRNAPFTKEWVLSLPKDIIGNCWIYKGSIEATGYARIKLANNKSIHLHRIVTSLWYGLDISDEKQFACHRVECSSRACFNPDHLYLGTNKSNQLDVIKKKQLTCQP